MVLVIITLYMAGSFRTFCMKPQLVLSESKQRIIFLLIGFSSSSPLLFL